MSHLGSIYLAYVLEKHTVIFFWSVIKCNFNILLLFCTFIKKKKNLQAYVKFLVTYVAVEITQHQSILEIELKLAILFFCTVIKYLIIPFVLQGINLRQMVSPLNGLNSTECPE